MTDNLQQIARELRQHADAASRAADALEGKAPANTHKRVLSISARKRIAAAQRARWAKQKKKVA